ncbi:MAG: hypothetical protein RJQ03_09985, partial [Miltoncostaeaceae bacterium]
MHLSPPLRLLLALLVLLGVVAGAGAQAERPAPVHVIEVEGTIDTVLADWFDGRVGSAESAGARLVILRVDTPGGLVSALEDMVATIRGTDLTVVTWVGPSGARAASAGAFLAAASDRVLMAPGTNIGSATPVSGTGEDLAAKITNDAAAGIAALAEENGRDADAYRAMVTDALNLTATEAVERDVSEGIAADVPAVMAALEGTMARDGTPLAVADAPVRTDSLPWYLRVLQVLTDPNLVYLLLIVAIAGITAEISSPGSIIPGAGGLIALLLAIAGISNLPFNWIGLALLAVAVGLMVAETQVPGFGALAGLGVVSMALGGAFLFGGSEDGISTSLWVDIPTAVVIGGGGALAARRVAMAHRNVPITGSD